jgi:hypothetical protein
VLVFAVGRILHHQMHQFQDMWPHLEWDPYIESTEWNTVPSAVSRPFRMSRSACHCHALADWNAVWCDKLPSGMQEQWKTKFYSACIMSSRVTFSFIEHEVWHWKDGHVPYQGSAQDCWSGGFFSIKFVQIKPIFVHSKLIQC